MSDEPKTYRKRERIKLDPEAKEDMVNAKDKIKKVRATLRAYTSREIQERARAASRDGIDVLWSIVLSPHAADRDKIAATAMLFDRGFGRPTQVAVTAQVNTDAAPKDIDRKSLEDRIKETLSAIDGAQQGEGAEEQGQNQSPDLRKLN